MKEPKVYEVSFTVVVWEEDVAEQAEVLGEQEKELDTAFVKRVVDADTIEVVLNGNTVDVRLLLVDAPETVHPDLPVEAFGAEAVVFAKQLLTGKQVQLEYDGPKYDDYGRLLAYVWINGRMFNELLLEKGLAHVAYVYHPPYRYYGRYVLAQQRAEVGRKGIWAVKGSGD